MRCAGDPEAPLKPPTFSGEAWRPDRSSPVLAVRPLFPLALKPGDAAREQDYSDAIAVETGRPRMSDGSGLIEIKVRQMSSGGIVDGFIVVPVEAIDWFGQIEERQLVSVRGEKFTVKDPEQLRRDVEAARAAMRQA